MSKNSLQKRERRALKTLLTNADEQDTQIHIEEVQGNAFRESAVPHIREAALSAHKDGEATSCERSGQEGQRRSEAFRKDRCAVIVPVDSLKTGRTSTR